MKTTIKKEEIEKIANNIINEKMIDDLSDQRSFSHAMSGIRIDSKFLIDAKLPNDFMEGDLSHVIREADIVIKNMTKLKQKIKNYKKG